MHTLSKWIHRQKRNNVCASPIASMDKRILPQQDLLFKVRIFLGTIFFIYFGFKNWKRDKKNGPERTVSRVSIH